MRDSSSLKIKFTVNSNIELKFIIKNPLIQQIKIELLTKIHAKLKSNQIWFLFQRQTVLVAHWLHFTLLKLLKILTQVKTLYREEEKSI